jgi:isopenicillin-N epimerase
VLFLSHVTAPTALILPVEALVRRARAAGIVTVIDGAHAPGQIALDLRATGADFYAGNCHKWMCAPRGSGFLYARREVQSLLEPLIVSWGWRPEKPGPSRFIDEHEWQGTRDLCAFLTVPAAIEFLRANDWDTVRRECHALARTTRATINRATGLPALCPDEDGWFGQMASVLLPACDAEAFAERLRDEFRIEVPVREWNAQQVLRFSIQGYNTQADAEALVAAVAKSLLGC